MVYHITRLNSEQVRMGYIAWRWEVRFSASGDLGKTMKNICTRWCLAPYLAMLVYK
jgi:hypothetical protein